MRAFMMIVFCSSPQLNKKCYHKQLHERCQININYYLQILGGDKKYQDDTEKQIDTTFNNA